MVNIKLEGWLIKELIADIFHVICFSSLYFLNMFNEINLGALLRSLFLSFDEYSKTPLNF